MSCSLDGLAHCSYSNPGIEMNGNSCGHFCCLLNRVHSREREREPTSVLATSCCVDRAGYTRKTCCTTIFQLRFTTVPFSPKCRATTSRTHSTNTRRSSYAGWNKLICSVMLKGLEFHSHGTSCNTAALVVRFGARPQSQKLVKLKCQTGGESSAHGIRLIAPASLEC